MTDIENVIIRRASKPDAKRIAEIESEDLCAAWSEKSITDALKNENYIYFAAVCGDVITGSAGMMLISPEAEITNIAVTKSFRRRGIAAALLSALLDEAFSHGCESVFLEVAQKNIPALRLYEKFGFKPVNIRKNYYKAPPDDAVIMIRNG